MAVSKRAIENDGEWKQWRNKVIGASEVGALLGIHDYLTYFELYQLKTGKLPVFEATEAMSDGLLMQEVALKKIQRNFPQLKAYDPKIYYCDSELGIGATPDCFAEDPEKGLGTIQIKHVDRDVFRKRWGDMPPLWICLQVTQEAWLSGAKWARICAIVADHGLNLHWYDVDIRDDVIAVLKKEVQEFWRRVRDEDPPAPDYSRDADTIRAVYPQDDGHEIDLTGDNEISELAEQYEQAAKLVSATEKNKKAIGAEIFHKMGKATFARYNGGYISAKTVFRAAHEVKASSYRPLKVVSK